MDDCVKKYRERRDERLKARQSSFHGDYGVPGMKWGEHKGENDPEEAPHGPEEGKTYKSKDDAIKQLSLAEKIMNGTGERLEKKKAELKIAKDADKGKIQSDISRMEKQYAEETKKLYGLMKKANEEYGVTSSDLSKSEKKQSELGKAKDAESVRAGGKEWTKQSLTKLWQDRGYGKRDAQKRAEVDFNEMVKSQKKTKEAEEEALKNRFIGPREKPKVYIKEPEKREENEFEKKRRIAEEMNSKKWVYPERMRGEYN